MKEYFSYFKLRFIASLQYRISALGSIITQLSFGIMNISIYVAFFKTDNINAPITLSQTVTYIWLNQAFFSMIYQFYRDAELLDIVRTGNIAYELIRPNDLYFMWFFKIFASRLAQVTLRFIPVILVAAILPKPYNISLPISLENFSFFLISIVLGSILSTAISVLNPIIVLKTLSEKGVSNILIAVSDILSGNGIPIPYFPNIIKIISFYLPFQYVSDLPFRIYIGNIEGTFILEGITMQIIWIIITIFIGYILLHNSLKRVVAQGG